MAEAELKRRDSLSAVVDWTLVDDASSATGLSDPVSDAEARLLLDDIKDRTPALVGTPSYYAGAAGTVSVLAGERVVGIVAHATTAGSMTIAGGPSIPLPDNVGLEFVPNGNYVGPLDIVFTGTDLYIVEILT